MNIRQLLTITLPLTFLISACVTSAPEQPRTISNEDRQDLVQKALEGNVSGQSSDLILSPEVKIVVTPVETWKSVTGHFCRSFITEVWRNNKLQTKTLSTACRNAYGNWVNVSI
ncbi:hypothetical protein GUA87_11755 [Sneathiella sp. P13V-1]|uniref:hypothetical protein n=1 Tax=Sneathiella sp. P13V-1 TaxID=2697366 RepID=UPI00187B780F|nr:hypothetical protein [Sneathiella sp. P13V-1]MBE7637522.1 hypothetical protein [Sneathiella sp. P13V-1]